MLVAAENVLVEQLFAACCMHSHVQTYRPKISCDFQIKMIFICTFCISLASSTKSSEDFFATALVLTKGIPNGDSFLSTRQTKF